MNKRYRSKEAKREGLGLPETLKILQYEKCTATISAKVEPSLREYILEHGGSCFIHTMIMKTLSEIQNQRQGR